MARPKRVNPTTLSQYNLLHTRKVKMYCGTELTGLHLVKETEKNYVSLESWSFCCGKFQASKKKTKLEVNIPILKDEKAVKFLHDNAWHDWVGRELKDGDADMIESIALLDKLFPGKKKVSFYELKSLVAAFCHGSFVRYEEDGKVEKTNPNQLKQRGYYNFKYQGLLAKNEIDLPKHVSNLFEEYRKQKTDAKKTEAYKKYREAAEKYMLESHDLTDTFIKLGENTVVCPYAFTRGTADWSIEKHGKEIAYAKAGELYMIVTDDTVYFEAERHY